MLPTCIAASDNRQYVRIKSELQKPLHAPAKNRQLTIIIAPGVGPTLAVRPEPPVVSATHYPNIITVVLVVSTNAGCGHEEERMTT